jgi:hypothetical protein
MLFQVYHRAGGGPAHLGLFRPAKAPLSRLDVVAAGRLTEGSKEACQRTSSARSATWPQRRWTISPCIAPMRRSSGPAWCFTSVCPTLSYQGMWASTTGDFSPPPAS